MTGERFIHAIFAIIFAVIGLLVFTGGIALCVTLFGSTWNVLECFVVALFTILVLCMGIAFCGLAAMIVKDDVL